MAKEEEEEDDKEEEAEGGRSGRATAKSSGVAIAAFSPLSLSLFL